MAGKSGNDWVTKRVPFGAGQEIFREGQPPRDAYLIERGRVEVSRMVSGEKVVLGYKEVGDILGEMALIDNQPRMATASAVEPTVCVLITSSMFQEHMNRATPLLRKLLTTFTKNLRDMAGRQRAH
jgi:CRP-like cAMP-binding protein